MEQITAYKASDGRLFETEREVKEHEASLYWRQRISKFLTTDLCPYRLGAQVGMVTKIVVAWEMFKVDELKKQSKE
jgi:hypothetical protein